jgi:hypothetical protein
MIGDRARWGYGFFAEPELKIFRTVIVAFFYA